MQKKDIFKRYQEKEMRTVGHLYKNIDSYSSMYIYHLILRKIKKNVIKKVRVHDIKLIPNLFEKINELKLKINIFNANNLQNKSTIKQNKISIKKLNKEIKGLRIVIAIYAKEIFYFKLQDEILLYFKQATNVQDSLFEQYVSLWTNKKIRYIHNAFNIKINGEKIKINGYVSSEEFLKKYNIL